MSCYTCGFSITFKGFGIIKLRTFNMATIFKPKEIIQFLC